MSYKPGIASMSLGRAWVHALPTKLDQAAAYGYSGIEVFYEDLEFLAKSLPGGLSTANLLTAATQIRSWCDARSLEVLVLQPFMHYEGITDPAEHAAKIAKLHVWFQLAHILGTDTIQIPSSFQAEGTTGDRATLVRDLAEVADLGARESPVIKFAYENLCWGRYIDTWAGAWDLVAAVDRANFGLCLDTFNIAGREWADPAAVSGTTGAAAAADCDAALAASMAQMVATVDVRKVFFVQVVDAERLRNPLTPAHVFHVDGQPPRMSWSRNCRLFPFERSGYLPIMTVLRALCDAPEDGGLGYTGWISFELFSRTMADPGEEVPREHARRGMESWWKVVEYMGWQGRVPPRKEVKVVEGRKETREVKAGMPVSTVQAVH